MSLDSLIATLSGLVSKSAKTFIHAGAGALVVSNTHIMPMSNGRAASLSAIIAGVAALLELVHGTL